VIGNMKKWDKLKGGHKFLLFMFVIMVMFMLADDDIVSAIEALGEGIWNKTAPYVFLANPGQDSVSIGGINATHKLDVVGDANITGTIYEGGSALSVLYLKISEFTAQIIDYYNITTFDTQIVDYYNKTEAGEQFLDESDYAAQIPDYINWTDGNNTYAPFNIDTNASTECSGSEVLLGNTSCMDIDGFDTGVGTTYSAGGNLTLTGTTFDINWTEIKSWLDNLYQVVGVYLTSEELNNTYAINSTFNQFEEYNYNQTIGIEEYQYNQTVGHEEFQYNMTVGVEEFQYNMSRDEFFYNQTTGAITYVDEQGFIVEYIDTNASSICSGSEALLGNGSCMDVEILDTDITYTAGSNLTLIGTVFSLDVINLVDWLSTLYQSIGDYITSSELNETYAINSSLEQFEEYNYNQTIGIEEFQYNMSRDEFFYNQTTPAETYADDTFLPLDVVNNSYARTDSKNIFVQDIIIKGNLTIIGEYINASVTNQYLNGSFLPDIDGLFDIGSLDYRWDNLYISKVYGDDWTNVTITESQVTDLQSYLTAEADPLFTAAISDYINITQMNKIIIEYLNSTQLNASYAINSTFTQFEEFNYNQTTPAFNTSEYQAGSNLTLTGIIFDINFIELKSWLDNLYQVAGDYFTSEEGNNTYVKLEDINNSYALNSSLNQYEEFNYNQTIGHEEYQYNQTVGVEEFQYNMTTGAITYADDTFFPLSEIVDYVNWSDGNRTYVEIGGDTIIRNLSVEGNISVGEYFYGQPLEGGIDGGIVWAAEVDGFGQLNLSHVSGLDITYPDMTVRIVTTPDGDEKYCNIPGDTVTVNNNAHEAYVVSGTDCSISVVPVATFVDAVINQAGNTPIFHVMAHGGEIKVHQGMPIQNRNYIRGRILSLKTINLDVVSGLSLTEEENLDFTIHSGEYVFVDQIVDTSTQNITDGAVLELFGRDGGNYFYDDSENGLNLTTCEDGSENQVECSLTSRYRRYFIFIGGYQDGDDETHLHQRLALDDINYATIANCLNTEINPITYDLPDIFTFTAVPLFAYCLQAKNDELSDGAIIDLRTVQTGQASGGIDTSVFLTKDGSRSLTNNWDAGSFNITTSDTITAGFFEGDLSRATSEWFYNMTIGAMDWVIEVLAGNESAWLSTYNATYDEFAYNQTDDTYNYNQTRDEFWYNQTQPAMDYTDEQGFITEYIDTNASSICSSEEVLLGNGSCQDSNVFFDNTDTIYDDTSINVTIEEKALNESLDQYMDWSIGNITFLQYLSHQEIDTIIKEYYNKTEADNTFAGIEWDYNQTTGAITYADNTFGIYNYNMSQAPWMDATGGIYYDGGNVGIGTSSPGYKLEIAGGDVNITDTTPYIRLEDSDSAGGIAAASLIDFYDNVNTLQWRLGMASGSNADLDVYNTNDNIHFFTNGVANMVINGTNVGIGTTTPSEALEIGGTGNISFGGTEGQIVWDSGIGPALTLNRGFRFTNTESWRFGMQQTSAGKYGFRADIPGDVGSGSRFFELYDTSGSNSRLFVDMNSGNVGIGTTNPTHVLNVVGNINASVGGRNLAFVGESTDDEIGIQLSDDDTTGYVEVAGGKMAIGGTAGVGANNLVVDVDGIYEGFVGIGTVSPTSPLLIVRNNFTAYDGSSTDGQLTDGATLHIAQTAGSNVAFAQLVLGARGGQPKNRIVASGGTSPFMAFTTNNAERMRIEDDGKVGIGTTSPEQKLTICGDDPNVFCAINLGFNSASTTPASGITWQTHPDGNVYIDTKLNTSAKHIINRIGSGTGHGYDTTWMKVATNGDVGIGNINPNNTLVVDGGVEANGFFVTSDRELKTNIKPITYTPFNLKLYEYNLKDNTPIYEDIFNKELNTTEQVVIGYEEGVKEETQIGIMADEVPTSCLNKNGFVNYNCVMLMKIAELEARIEVLEGK